MFEASGMALVAYNLMRRHRKSGRIRRRKRRKANYLVGLAANLRLKAKRYLETAEFFEDWAKRLDADVKIDKVVSSTATAVQATVAGNEKSSAKAEASRRAAPDPKKLIKSNQTAAAVWDGNTFSFRYLAPTRDGKRKYMVSFTFDKVAELTTVLGKVAGHGTNLETLDSELRKELAYYAAALAKVPVMVANKKKDIDRMNPTSSPKGKRRARQSKASDDVSNINGAAS